MADERRHNIVRLDLRTSAAVRGSQVIGSVWRAIEELLRNSVEGCATSCTISVGLDEIVVCDDGIGIDPEAMRLFIGTEYCSNNGVGSECRKGESLLSLAALCGEMKIETSCWWNANGSIIRNRNTVFEARQFQLVRTQKAFRDGSVVFFNQSFGGNNSHCEIIPKTFEIKEFSGTTVKLSKVFHQHAVRRKQTEGGSHALELNQIGTSLRLLALCYPCVAFELKNQSNLVTSYKTYSERLKTFSADLSIESHALLFRLSEIYPNDFNEDSTKISYDAVQLTGFKAFGVVSILEDSVAMRDKELEVVTINGRLATEAARLVESVISQIRSLSCVKPSSKVRFFIHVITESSNEVVVKDSIATVSVPLLDLLIVFLREMLAENGFREKDLMHDIEKVASERNINKQWSNRSSGLVEGRQIVSNFLTANYLSKGTISQPSSPFSDAFYNDYFILKQSTKAITNVTADMHAFEDAFIDQDSQIGSLSTNINNSTADFDDDYEHDSAVLSSLWTKQRINTLEKYITDIAPDSNRNEKLSVTKNMLATAEVIAQIDHKYIIIRAGDILCAVDQHAADERIALEKLENSLFNHIHDDIIHMTKRSIKAADIIKLTRLVPSKRISLSQTQMSTIKYHWSLLQKWNFKMEETVENALLLTGVPSVCDRVTSVNDFLDFVQELSHVTGSEIKPAFVKNILASNACRYATMFGDPLTQEQCVELISGLAKCKLSFLCAHGRPSIVPLFSLSSPDPREIRLTPHFQT